MSKCKCNKQIQIGENGEVVTISLSEYEDLLKYKEMVDNNVVIPVEEYETLLETADRMRGLEK